MSLMLNELKILFGRKQFVLLSAVLLILAFPYLFSRRQRKGLSH